MFEIYSNPSHEFWFHHRTCLPPHHDVRLSQEEEDQESFLSYPNNMYRRLALLLMYALRNVCRASSSKAAFVHQSRTLSVLTIPVVGKGTTVTASVYHRSSVGQPGHYSQSARKYRSSALAQIFSSSQDSIFAQDPDFAALGVQMDVLLRRLERMGLERPTAVQSATYKEVRESHKDVTIGAETGSGKVS